MSVDLRSFLLGATAVCFLSAAMLLAILGAGRWQEHRRHRAALNAFLRSLGVPARTVR